MSWEEVVNFGAGVADAGLEVEDGDAWGARTGEARTGEEGYRKRVRLGVVGTDEGEKSGFTGACGNAGE